MTPIVAAITAHAAALTVAADIILIWLIASIALPGLRGRVFLWVGRHGIVIAFIMAAAGVAGSLFYSEFAEFPMCVLCVFQRVLLVPQMVVLGIGVWRRRRIYADTALVLAVSGALVAAYNQYLQFGGTEFIPCGAEGGACAKRFFLEFGYVTIPMMALTCFGLIVAVLIAKKIVSSSVEKLEPAS